MTDEQKAQYENVGVALAAFGVVALSIGVGLHKGFAIGLVTFGVAVVIVGFAMIVGPK